VRNIFIFGDSFAEYSYDGIRGKNHWPNLLEFMLKDYAKIHPTAVSGSGLTFSLHRFHRLYEQSQFQKQDVIIFFMTSDERLYAETMPHPRLGMVGTLDQYYSIMEDWRPWIDQNREGLEWAYLNIFDLKINYELQKVASFLKTWADNHENNLVILFNNFENGKIDFVKKIKNSKNFFNFTQVPVHTLSINECGFDKESALLENNRLNAGDDWRCNHLTAANCSIMATMLKDVIKLGDPTHWDFNKFKKHIYRLRPHE
jgi:hypothetical protein